MFRKKSINDEAAFWKALAQKKVGDLKRRFLENSPEVEKVVRDVLRK